MINKLTEQINNLGKYNNLIIELVIRDIKVKYKRSVLGLIWSILNPLLMMSVMTIIFSSIFKSDIKNFPVYLISGQVIFNFFSDTLLHNPLAFVAGRWYHQSLFDRPTYRQQRHLI